MFTHQPRAGHGLGTTARKAGAVVTAFAVGTGLTLVGGSAASAADEVPTSFAHAQFLSGSLLGLDLADVAALEGATAYNDGTKDKVTSKDPLHATVLDTIDINVPGGVQLPVLSDYVDAGAVNQYAEASSGGHSMASAGAIGDDGAIGVGNVGSGSAGDLDVDLKGLLGASYAANLTDLRLSLEAVAAQAIGNLDTASGNYTLAGATLHFTSPAIADLTDKVLTSLGVVNDTLGRLTGSAGILALDVSGLIKALGVVADPTVSVSLSADLEAAVRELLVEQYNDGAVSFDLGTGSVSIDLEALLGGSLNNLPPNTELLTDAVIGPVLTGITNTLDSLVQSIVTRVDETLRQARLDVDVDLDLTTPVLGKTTECLPIVKDVVGPVGATVDDVLNGLVGGTIGGVSNGLPLGQVISGVGLDHLLTGLGLGGLVGGLLGGGTSAILPTTVLGQVTETVCNVVDTVLDTLNTSVHVDVHGTLQQILNGKPGSASASVVVLGVPVTLSIDSLLNALIGNLTDSLFDNDGALQKLLAALNLNLLDPATEGLLGATGLEVALTDILSIKVNVQETWIANAGFGMAVAQSGSMFTETAVRVSALGAAAVINVAAATVGPNINRVVDPENPGCTVNCGPGGPGDPENPNGSAGGGGSLAMTGVGIATLVAVILALLAAGAYLAREGYRRNHPQAA